jgi:predicted O-methyltransferase YrrM
MTAINDATKIQSKLRLMRFFLKFYYYASRIALFIFITIRVFLHGLLHPEVIFNFLFGVVTEIAEFHKRCGGAVKNFKETKVYQHILDGNYFPKSNCFNAGFGNVRPTEAQVIATLVAHFKPKTVFEIGTYDGFSTLHFEENAPVDTIVYTLDLPKDRTGIKLKNDPSEAHRDIKNINMNALRQFHGRSKAGRIIELFGDSMSFDFSPYYGKMDLVFIDANHSYSYVKADTQNALKMLSPQGVILWHDYDFIHPGVFRVVNETAKGKQVFYIERTRFAIFLNANV